jgi:hypothetical protein
VHSTVFNKSSRTEEGSRWLQVNSFDTPGNSERMRHVMIGAEQNDKNWNIFMICCCQNTNLYRCHELLTNKHAFLEEVCTLLFRPSTFEIKWP